MAKSPDWMRLNDRTWKVIVFLVLSFLVVVIGRPMFRELKLMRAQRLVAKGQSLHQAGKLQEALDNAQAALHLVPLEESALRLGAHVLSDAGNPQAIKFYEALVTQPRLSQSDRIDLIECAMRFHDVPTAEKHVGLALALMGREADTRVYRLAARLGVMQNRPELVLRATRAAVAHDTNDVQMQLVLANTLFSQTDLAPYHEGKEMLWRLADLPNATGLEALAALSRGAGMSAPELIQVQHALTNRNDLGPDYRFLLADLRIRIEPKRQNDIIRETVRLAPTAVLSNRLELARWLMTQKEPQRITNVIPWSIAKTNRDGLLLHLDALAALKQWPALQIALAFPSLPLEPALVALYQARVAKELGDQRLERLHWDQVHSLASDQPAVLFYVAQYAERSGESPQAIKAYRQLTRLPEVARPAYAGLVRLTERTGRTAELRQLIHEISTRFPDEVEPLNDLVYLDLLLGDNIEASRSISYRLVKDNPSLLALRTTHALALLRTKDPAGAFAVFKGFQIDWATALPGWQAVYAAVLGANGETNAARAMAKRVAVPALKPEELELLRPWM